MKNSELKIVVISFSDDFTKNSESLITTLWFLGCKFKLKFGGGGGSKLVKKIQISK